MLGLIVAVLGLLLLLNVFTRGKISYTAPPNSTVSIYKMPENKLVLTTGEGDYSHRLGSGDYVLVGDFETGSFKQGVTVTRFSNSKVEITPASDTQSVRISEQGVASAGFVDGRILQQHPRAPVLLDVNGETVYEQYQRPIQKIVYGVDTIGELTNDGSFGIIQNGSKRTFYNVGEANSFVKILDFDYDEAKDEYCLLQESGAVLYVTKNGVVSEPRTLESTGLFIDCHGGNYATGELFQPGDLTGVFREGELYFTTNTETQKINTTELYSVKVIPEGVLYIDSKSVRYFDQSNKKTEIVQNTTSQNPEALHLLGDSPYLFDETSAWVVNLREKRSDRLLKGLDFRGISGAGITDSGALFYGIADLSAERGLYLQTQSSGLAEAEETLRNILPKEDYFFRATYSVNDNSITVRVKVLGDIPTTKRSTERALEEARKFIKTLELPDSVKVTYF